MIFVALFTIVSAQSSSWPTSYEDTPETRPIIEVSLHPPIKPLPEVSGEIELLDSQREKRISTGMAMVQSSLNEAFSGASGSIEDAVRNAVSSADIPALIRKHQPLGFLQLESKSSLNDGEETTGISVASTPVEPVNIAVKGELDAFGEQQAVAEAKFFEKASKDTIPSLIPSLVAEFKRALESQLSDIASGSSSTKVTSFLQQKETSLPSQTNVKIGTSKENWPSVESLISASLQRSAESEKLVKTQFLDEEAKLFELGNNLLRENVAAAIAKVLSQPL